MHVTSRPKVYAAGDVVTGPKTVAKAIATGKKAVKSIDDYLSSDNSLGGAF